jgi:hypothetical protein
MSPLRDSSRATLLVVEDEHADGAGLSIPGRREHGWRDSSSGVAQDVCDWADLVSRPGAEERDRDVEVLERNRADAVLGQLVALPVGDRPGRGLGQTEAEKEAKALISLDATRRGHAEV